MVGKDSIGCEKPICLAIISCHPVRMDFVRTERASRLKWSPFVLGGRGRSKHCRARRLVKLGMRTRPPNWLKNSDCGKPCNVSGVLRLI